MKVLWAPWRMDYILGEDKHQGCIFCPEEGEDCAERLIRFYAYPGAHVLDPFAGSGTTGVAALRLGCRASLVDIDETGHDPSDRAAAFALASELNDDGRVPVGLIFRRVPKWSAVGGITWGLLAGVTGRYLLGWDIGPQVYLSFVIRKINSPAP